jgi:hypothetical protein
MKQLINLHKSLFKFLKTELKKRRTPSKLVHFLYDTLKKYSQALLTLYKQVFLVFDKEYMKQKAEYEKRKKLMDDMRRCVRLLQYINEKWEKKFNKQQSKQKWHDFVKSYQLRKEEFEALMKEIY